MRYGPENPVLETANFQPHETCSENRDCEGCGMCLQGYDLADRVIAPFGQPRHEEDPVAIKIAHIQRGLRKTHCQHPEALEQIATANLFIEQNRQ